MVESAPQGVGGNSTLSTKMTLSKNDTSLLSSIVSKEKDF